MRAIGKREKSRSKRDGNGKTVRQVKKYNTRSECKVKGERKRCRCRGKCNAFVHPKWNRTKLIFQYRFSFLLFSSRPRPRSDQIRSDQRDQDISTRSKYELNSDENLRCNNALAATSLVLLEPVLLGLVLVCGRVGVTGWFCEGEAAASHLDIKGKQLATHHTIETSHPIFHIQDESLTHARTPPINPKL